MSNTSFIDFLHKFVQEYFYKEALKELKKNPAGSSLSPTEQEEARNKLNQISTKLADQVVKKLDEMGIKSEEDISQRENEFQQTLVEFLPVECQG